MRIVFDARWIRAQSSGIGVYAGEMSRRLPALMPDFEFVFMDSQMFPHGPLSWKSQLLLPKWLDKTGADVFHSPNYMIPYFWKGRIVANIHDVIPLAVAGYAPKSLTSRFKLLYKFCLKSTALKADAIITGSESARGDLVRILKLDGGVATKIKVIYDGADGGGNRGTPEIRKRGMKTNRGTAE